MTKPESKGIFLIEILVALAAIGVICSCLFCLQNKPNVSHPNSNIFITPVKVSLNGEDAQLNSDNHFMISLNGFKQKEAMVIQTTGGLNPNEAWLIADRDFNGLFQNKIVDGDDVFGDHMGKYKSGYEDLAATFKNDLDADNYGKRYIKLHSVPKWQRFLIWICRLFGLFRKLDASTDLMLLSRNNAVFDASDYFKKIYVDYESVNESDKSKKNWIRQRAPVVYKDKKIADSADQYFKPQ